MPVPPTLLLVTFAAPFWVGAADLRRPAPASGRVGAQTGLIAEVAAQGPAGEPPGAAWASTPDIGADRPATDRLVVSTLGPTRLNTSVGVSTPSVSTPHLGEVLVKRKH